MSHTVIVHIANADPFVAEIAGRSGDFFPRVGWWVNSLSCIPNLPATIRREEASVGIE